MRTSALCTVVSALAYGGLPIACSSGDSSGPVDGGAHDATSDAPVGAHDGGGGGIFEADAASICAPNGALPKTPGYTFTPNGSGACDDDQLQTLFASCLGDSGTNAGCNDFASAFNESCYTCVFGSSTDTLLAPLYITSLSDGSGYIIANAGGCIEAYDPSEQACAQSEALADTCEYNECSGCSSADFTPIPTDPFGQIDVCVNDAEKGSCASLQAAEDACNKRLIGNDPGGCLNLYNDDGEYSPSFFAYVTKVCGGAPSVDAGADGASDASTDGGDAGDASDAG